MAAAPKVITVDLGTSSLKVAEFSVGKGGVLTLQRFGVADLGLDPNKEEDRAQFITPTLAKLVKDQGIKGKEVVLSISGQSVFMRFVKLPPVDPAQVEQVVAFEAQQNVPFPINEVTWDYQMMPNRGSGTEAEAVIVAIKKEILESEVAAVEAVGFKVKNVDIAPFALLNAFRYSETQTDDCALIIDMGARSTNLVFVEKSSFWIRNVPIAGNQISQSICNEMQEPFMAAETLKKGKGFVSLGGVYADPDDVDAARISKLIRSTMTRLHVDINRSIAYYRNTLNGGAPKRVFLTGGSSQLPYLDLFIADKLSLPVTYFNPLRNVSLGKSLNTAQIQQNHCYTSELVGLALRETGSCPAEVTLDAPSLQARASKRRKQPYYFAALVAWAVLLACLSLYYVEQTNLAKQKTEELTEKAGTLPVIKKKIVALAAEEGSLQQTFNLAAALGDQHDKWQAILAALNDKIPEGVWVTELTPQNGEGATNEAGGRNPRGGPAAAPGAAAPNNRNLRQGGPGGGESITGLTLNGLYHSNQRTQIIQPDQLRDFVLSLVDLPYFDIDPKNISLSYTTPGGNTAFAQKFTIQLKLKQPISLRAGAASK